jgi:hypothetical protein
MLRRALGTQFRRETFALRARHHQGDATSLTDQEER